MKSAAPLVASLMLLQEFGEHLVRSGCASSATTIDSVLPPLLKVTTTDGYSLDISLAGGAGSHTGRAARNFIQAHLHAFPELPYLVLVCKAWLGRAQAEHGKLHLGAQAAPADAAEQRAAEQGAPDVRPIPSHVLVLMLLAFLQHERKERGVPLPPLPVSEPAVWAHAEREAGEALIARHKLTLHGLAHIYAMQLEEERSQWMDPGDVSVPLELALPELRSWLSLWASRQPHAAPYAEVCPPATGSPSDSQTAQSAQSLSDLVGAPPDVRAVEPSNSGAQSVQSAAAARRRRRRRAKQMAAAAAAAGGGTSRRSSALPRALPRPKPVLIQSPASADVADTVRLAPGAQDPPSADRTSGADPLMLEPSPTAQEGKVHGSSAPSYRGREERPSAAPVDTKVGSAPPPHIDTATFHSAVPRLAHADTHVVALGWDYCPLPILVPPDCPLQPPGVLPLGPLLVRFMRFFGVTLDHVHMGLSVRGGGYMVPLSQGSRLMCLPSFFKSAKAKASEASAADEAAPLHLEDPLLPGQSVASCLGAFARRRQQLSRAADALEAFKPSAEAPSLLSTLIPKEGTPDLLDPDRSDSWSTWSSSASTARTPTSSCSSVSSFMARPDSALAAEEVSFTLHSESVTNLTAFSSGSGVAVQDHARPVPVPGAGASPPSIIQGEAAGSQSAHAQSQD